MASKLIPIATEADIRRVAKAILDQMMLSDMVPIALSDSFIIEASFGSRENAEAAFAAIAIAAISALDERNDSEPSPTGD